MSLNWKRALRKLGSERGSVYMEYALLSCLVLLTAFAAFAPGSIIYRNIGRDYLVRTVFMKLPLF